MRMGRKLKSESESHGRTQLAPNCRKKEEGRLRGGVRTPNPPGWLHRGLVRPRTIPFLAASVKRAHLQKPETKLFMRGKDWEKGLEEFHLGRKTKNRGPLPTNAGPSPSESSSKPRPVVEKLDCKSCLLWNGWENRSSGVQIFVGHSRKQIKVTWPQLVPPADHN